MKIKTDFVTNSSSTSFILTVEGDFSKENFFRLIGIQNDSPLEPLFVKLFELIVREMRLADEIEIEKMIEEAPPNVVSKIVNARQQGRDIYHGELSTEDGDPIESLFCVESFEAENENIYLNYLECVW